MANVAKKFPVLSAAQIAIIAEALLVLVPVVGNLDGHDACDESDPDRIFSRAAGVLDAFKRAEKRAKYAGVAERVEAVFASARAEGRGALDAFDAMAPGLAKAMGAKRPEIVKVPFAALRPCFPAEFNSDKDILSYLKGINIDTTHEGEKRGDKYAHVRVEVKAAPSPESREAAE